MAGKYRKLGLLGRKKDACSDERQSVPISKEYTTKQQLTMMLTVILRNIVTIYMQSPASGANVHTVTMCQCAYSHLVSMCIQSPCANVHTVTMCQCPCGHLVSMCMQSPGANMHTVTLCQCVRSHQEPICIQSPCVNVHIVTMCQCAYSHHVSMSI